jgi:sec-independent protein translocase protein TatA
MILLLFGVKRTPELAEGLGAGMREFKTGAEGDYDEEGEGHKRRLLEASAEDGRSEGVADI